MRHFGYVCTDGAFDAKPSEVTGWTNLYVAWAYYEYWKGGESTATWMSRMATCVKRVYNTTNLNIYLGLFGQIPENLTTAQITAVFTLMKPYWNRVVAIDIADEPQWTRQETKTNLKKVRGILASMKLPYKPIGITYTSLQSTGGSDAFGIAHIKDGKLVGPDFVTLELYTLPQDQGFAKNMAYITTNTKKAWTLLDPSTRCFYWLQGYNRNGAFPDEDSLAKIQVPSYDLVKGNARSDGLLIFNWARGTPQGPSKGSKWMPKVAAQHKIIGKAMGVGA